MDFFFCHLVERGASKGAQLIVVDYIVPDFNLVKLTALTSVS
jgi:hypothetical protein